MPLTHAGRQELRTVQPPVNTRPKPPKELQGITEKDLDCVVCQEPAENAVNCVKCQNILCESHLISTLDVPDTANRHHSRHKPTGSSDDSSPNWKCHVRSAERPFRVETCQLTLKHSVQNEKWQNRVEPKIRKR